MTAKPSHSSRQIPDAEPSDLPFLPYGRQDIDAADIAAVVNVLQSDFLTTGPAVEKFETALGKVTHAKHNIACANGTAALHLAALALDLGPGDVVIVPAITFLATANAARFVGADVLFADVDPTTGLMTAETLQRAIETAPTKFKGKLKAVFNVHLNGQCTDLGALAKVAKSHNLVLVNDACHAIGGSYKHEDKWRAIGDCAVETMSCFSFHPVKTIAMGEGGAISTNSDDLAKRLKSFRSHGMSHENFTNPAALDEHGSKNPWYYEMHEPGYNYRITDIQCALGTSQLTRLDSFISRRREITAQYDKAFADLSPLLKPLAREATSRPAWHLYPVLIDYQALGKTRAKVMKELRDANIGTQVHYIPLTHQPYYQGLYGDISVPGAEEYYSRILSLPLYASLSDENVARVVAAVKHITSL